MASFDGIIEVLRVWKILAPASCNSEKEDGYVKVDQRVINGINKNNVLELIRQSDAISRAELARQTQLSLPTVMKITEELIAQGIVCDYAKGKSTGGKPPKLLRFNYQAGYIIGVDIDNYRMDAILMDLKAGLVCERSHDIHAHMRGETFADMLVRMLRTLIEESGMRKSQILGIGISTTGGSEAASHPSLREYLCGWGEKGLEELLARTFELPVVFENSVYAKALGEKMVGNAANIENFVFVDFGHEVSAAIVVDHQLYNGSHGRAGDLGHMIVEPQGYPCKCGKKGCLNTIASQRAIGERAKEMVAALKPGEYSMMFDMVYGHVEHINFYTVIEAAENGDRTAQEILGDVVRRAGGALCGITGILDPEVIFVSGKIVDGSRMFIRELKQFIESGQAYGASQVEVRTSSLGPHIGAIGAASNVLNLFLRDGAVYDRRQAESL